MIQVSSAQATATHDPAAYEHHRGYVLAVLARRCGWLADDEREAIFHDAYLVLLQKEACGDLETIEMHPHQLRAYIVQTAINKALDEGKRVERRRSEPIDEQVLAAPDAGPAPEELASASLDNARLREVVAGLAERQQTIVKLRFYFDRSPGEIQGLLGITERTYRRELERALKQVAEGYTLVREGRFCEGRRSMILAYVAGIAGPNRARDAADHLASCPACACWAAEVREAARRASVLLPLPAIGASPGWVERLQGAVEVARDGASHLVTGAKQHAASMAARLDPSGAGYTLTARPGAATATILGCLALGGGATYCAVEGIPGWPDRSPAPRAAKPSERPAAAEAPEPKRAVPVTAAPRQPKQSPARSSAPGQASGGAAASSAAATTQEFGLEGSAQSPGGATVTPPPAPQPPGEFDP